MTSVPRAWYALRMRRHMALTALLAAALIAPAASHAALVADQDGNARAPALDKLASTILGSPATVTCYPHDDNSLEDAHVFAVTHADGTITIDPDIYLDGDHCGTLLAALNFKPASAWARDAWTSTQAVGLAILALTHEAMHVRLASVDECRVERTAFANAWPSLRLLHLPARFERESWRGVRQAFGNFGVECAS